MVASNFSDIVDLKICINLKSNSVSKNISFWGSIYKSNSVSKNISLLGSIYKSNSTYYFQKDRIPALHLFKNFTYACENSTKHFSNIFGEIRSNILFLKEITILILQLRLYIRTVDSTVAPML